MREIEKQILAKLASGKAGSYQLSVRDRVRVYMDGALEYSLWDTRLFHRSCTGVCMFYFSNIAADTADCMSATTSSRIHMLMHEYADGHFLTRYKGMLSHGDTRIKTNTWYIWNSKYQKLEEAD